MKKTSLVLLALTSLTSTHVFALGLGLGLQGGVNFANVSAPTNISTSSVTGLMIGMNVEMRLTDDIAIQPELMYVQRGIKYTDISGAAVTAHYDALEIPVLLKIKFLEGVRPYVFAGPVAIVNISRGISVGSGSTTVSFNPRSTDFAFDFGAGVEFGFVFVNLRYSLGISDLNENSASWHSRGIQLLAGVEF